MRFARALLLASGFGTVAVSCTSDLELSLENADCNAQKLCAPGYSCDRGTNRCVVPSEGGEPFIPKPADAGQGTGGTSAGQGGAAGNVSGGASGSGGTSGNAGSGGSAGQGGAGGSADALDAGPEVPLDGGDACVPARVYRDGDNDTYGDEDNSRTRCPGRGWVLDGTDCRDDLAEVNPGQREFFDTGYQTPGGVSFDYDCTRAEEPSPNNNTNDEAPACGGLGATCVGSGFLPASDTPRQGPGVVDQRCGSVRRRVCRVVGLGCQPDDTPVDISLTFRCR